jgi:hypothetical protein
MAVVNTISAITWPLAPNGRPRNTCPFSRIRYLGCSIRFLLSFAASAQLAHLSLRTNDCVHPHAVFTVAARSFFFSEKYNTIKNNRKAKYYIYANNFYNYALRDCRKKRLLSDYPEKSLSVLYVSLSLNRCLRVS